MDVVGLSLLEGLQLGQLRTDFVFVQVNLVLRRTEVLRTQLKLLRVGLGGLLDRSLEHLVLRGIWPSSHLALHLDFVSNDLTKALGFQGVLLAGVD